MANPQNYFKPGQSGNPHGRPKSEWTWRGEILKALERENLDGVPMKQGVAEALVDKALQGDVIAIREIGNRADGLPMQSIDHTTNGKDLPTPLLQGIVNEIRTDDSGEETSELN